jgi:subtilisin-like proprotein convertase family protein
MRPLATLVCALAAAISAQPADAQPANDACASATTVIPGAPIVSSILNSTNDGFVSCSLATNGDVYHTFTTTLPGVYTIDLCAVTAFDSVISLHTGCPADVSTEVACDDDGCAPLSFGSPSKLRALLPAATSYIIRVAGFEPGMTVGDYQLRITPPVTPTGGCCLLNVCALQTQAQCQNVSGTFSGANTACSAQSATYATFNNVGAPAPIPDNAPAGISRTITVGPSVSFPIADVKVFVNVTHPFMGDLRMTLTKDSIVVPLMTRAGQPSSPLGFDFDLDGVYTFSDDAPGTVWQTGYTLPVTATALPTGSYRASDAEALAISLRQAFDGVESGGDWTLTIADLGAGDAGTLITWSIQFIMSSGSACATPPSGACCTGTPQGGLGPICTFTTQTNCTSIAGSWRGPGVACGTTNNPVACCKVNFNQINGVNIDDIFIFLNAWFARDPLSDFDGLNGITLDDIFIFINSWFVGCS